MINAFWILNCGDDNGLTWYLIFEKAVNCGVNCFISICLAKLAKLIEISQTHYQRGDEINCFDWSIEILHKICFFIYTKLFKLNEIWPIDIDGLSTLIWLWWLRVIRKMIQYPFQWLKIRLKWWYWSHVERKTIRFIQIFII